MSDELFRNNEAREQDAREWERARRNNQVNLKAFLMTIAIVVAPFLALVLSLDLALGVLAVALGFTTWLTWMVAEEQGAMTGSRLRVAAALNGVLMVVVLLILVGRLTL